MYDTMPWFFREKENDVYRWSDWKHPTRTRTTIKPYTYYQPPNKQEYNSIVYNIPYSSVDDPNNYNTSLSWESSNKYSETQSQSTSTRINENSKYNEKYHEQQNRNDLQYVYKNGKNYIKKF